MKTKIARTNHNQRIELVVDEGQKRIKKEDRKILAAMTLFHGTGAWMMTDIRLHQHRRPSAYSGSLFADDIHAHFKPATEQEAVVVRVLLREFREDAEGFHWSSYEGLVRGTPRHDSIALASGNHVGYFTRVEGLAYLEEVQAWWDAFEGDFKDAKIDNPHRQLSASQVMWKMQQLARENAHG